jgi:type I restriction enzyme S subunit
VSELPQGWFSAHISDILTVRNGYAFKSSDFSEAGVPLVRQSELKGDEIDISDAVLLPREFLEIHSGYIVNKGDVLIGMSGSLGRVSVYTYDQPALQNQRTGLLNVNCRIADRRFALYALKFVEPDILAQGKGIAVQNISSSQIESCRVPLPPRAEQTRIVEKLEELLSDLDAGVAELKAAQKKLGQYRQSLLKAAVEGALTAEWRKQNVPFETGAQLLDRILLERRARWEAKQLAKFKEQGKTPPKDWQKKYPEPVQPDTSDLPPLPEGWVWAKVAQTGKVQLGRQRAPQYHTGSNMVPYLRVANVFENRIDISDVMEMHFSEKEEQLFKLHANDILLNEGQSLELVGRPAIYRNELPLACFTNTLVRFRAEDGVIPEFALTLFLHYMHSGRFRKIATITTNIAHLGAGRFAEVEFPLPSTEEQREIMSALTETMENLVRQQDAISLALKQSTAQRQNILRAAFSGQLVPQDPTDEPASVLLERIRAERAAHAAVKKPRGRKVREATA